MAPLLSHSCIPMCKMRPTSGKGRPCGHFSYKLQAGYLLIELCRREVVIDNSGLEPSIAHRSHEPTPLRFKAPRLVRLLQHGRDRSRSARNENWAGVQQSCPDAVRAAHAAKTIAGMH